MKHACLMVMAVILCACRGLVCTGAEPDLDASLVEVIATHQSFNVRVPWQKNPPQTKKGYAVIIGAGRALTAETLVRDHTQLELRRAKSGLKLMASVQIADEQRNLALLQYAPGGEAELLRPVALAAPVRHNDRLTMVKMEPNGAFQTSAGQVVEISATGNPRPLVMKILTSLDVRGVGLPVFAGDRLAGLSVAYNDKLQIASCAACMTIGAFLTDAQSASYKGLAWAGINFEPLLDPAQRRYLGAPDTQAGFLITRITPGSGASHALQVGDVVLRWDGFDIDAQGYYQDPEFGRLHCAYLIGARRAPGDTVSVDLIRARRPQTVQVPLTRRVDTAELIPEQITEEPIEYLVEGGLVLRELTGDYLRAAGPDWKLRAHPRLVYYYSYPEQVHKRPGDHVVILSMVLPDTVNIGYQQYRDQVVTAVNGRPVASMRDVFEAVDAVGGLRRLTLLGGGVDIVLDHDQLPEANPRIATQYRIPSLRRQKAGDAAGI